MSSTAGRKTARKSGTTSEMTVTPEYLRELADIADPDQLWKLPIFTQLELPPEKRQQLDMGIALRRHAHDVAELNALRGTGRSLLKTPLTIHGVAIKTVVTPKDHRRLLLRG